MELNSETRGTRLGLAENGVEGNLIFEGEEVILLEKLRTIRSDFVDGGIGAGGMETNMIYFIIKGGCG